MVSFAEKPIRFPNQATILDHLTKFVNYEIRIIAYNSAGNSPHSTPTIIYVGEAGRYSSCLRVLKKLFHIPF